MLDRLFHIVVNNAAGFFVHCLGPDYQLDINNSGNYSDVADLAICGPKSETVLIHSI